MSYVVFARRYRPRTFAEVVGQEAVARTLRNAITQDRVGHAYLFCGPRGVGKTSMARIFARALNCASGPTPDPCGSCEPCRSIAQGTDVDVIEIDGASNRGVEDARRLRQSVAIAPSRCRLKIYIIDEVHMLTTESFNTLLKTLEEPPPHVKFIMATTEPHRILDTIHSRCQRFDFRRISQEHIVERLQQICSQEEVEADPAVLRDIARAARGGMRDSQSYLDQVISFAPEGRLAPEHLERILGRMAEEDLRDLLGRIMRGDLPAAFGAVAQVYERGLDPEAFLDQLIDALRALLVVKSCGAGAAGEILDEAPEQVARLDGLAPEADQDRLHGMLSILLETAGRLRWPSETQPRLVLELGLYQVAAAARLLPVSEILTRLERLERLDGDGGATAGRPSGPAPVHPAADGPGPPVPARTPRTGGPGRTRQQRRSGPRGQTPPPPPPPPPEPDLQPARSRGAATKPAAAPAAPPGSAAPPAPGATSDLEVETLRSRWPDLVAALEERYHDLGALAHDATVAGVGEGTLTLELPAGYEGHAKQLQENGSRRRLQEALGQLLGEPCNVRIVLASGETAPQEPAATPAPERVDPRQHLRDPRVQLAMQLLGGQVVTVEEPDEAL